jgi:GNAT superfamily N-acetyltransferase
MFWRTSRTEFARRGNSGNRADFEARVRSGAPAGVIAYVDGAPAGWISVAPRHTYPSLERSRTLKRIDAEPVWSIVCFFIDREYRGEGLMPALIEAAADYARNQGADLLEAYPTDPAVKPRTPAEAYMGVLPVFEKAGFYIVARPTPGRVIVRRRLA